MSGERASLDEALAVAGEDVILRRRTAAGDVLTDIDVTCRARIDTVDADEIAGTITTKDLKIILSPTPIIAAEWPAVGKANVPRVTDFVVVRGKLHQVKVVDAKIIGAEGLCRINLVVAG
jgi:hypothetical protein